MLASAWAYLQGRGGGHGNALGHICQVVRGLNVEHEASRLTMALNRDAFIVDIFCRDCLASVFSKFTSFLFQVF